ncbi:hypothetical protein BDW42DRAFT_167665 [Aspergillus taichungensis]|uniref:Transmembrane protein n=1 Tax=Aspergillus taichungensis TaxID=482145 RepID=A0A2J5HWX2_9EURO|nr:hypothetical protein BDW42DRAFT_167665 [Aspergillus taichungensis]
MNPITRLTAVRMEDVRGKKRTPDDRNMRTEFLILVFFFRDCDEAGFRMVLLMVISSVFIMTLVYLSRLDRLWIYIW